MNFDRVYCIHVPNQERRERIQRELDKMGMVATFVYANKPPAALKMSNMRRRPCAEFGVNLSHIKAVVTAMQDGAQSPLFIEDDIVFESWARDRLAEIDLPEWDVLYFGGHPREPVKGMEGNLVRIGTFSFAEAYAINGRALWPFFSYWCNRISQQNAMYDFILGEFAAKNHGYCTYPLLTRQRNTFSSISEAVDDKSGLVQRGWLKNMPT